MKAKDSYDVLLLSFWLLPLCFYSKADDVIFLGPLEITEKGSSQEVLWFYTPCTLIFEAYRRNKLGKTSIEVVWVSG